MNRHNLSYKYSVNPTEIRAILLATWPNMSYLSIKTISEPGLETMFDNDGKNQYPSIKNDGPFIYLKYHQAICAIDVDTCFNDIDPEGKNRYAYFTNKCDIYLYHRPNFSDRVIMASEVMFEGQVVLEPVAITASSFVSVISDTVTQSPHPFDIYNFPENIANKIQKLVATNITD